MPPTKMTDVWPIATRASGADLEEQVSEITLGQKITGLAGSVASKQNDETEKQAGAAVAT